MAIVKIVPMPGPQGPAGVDGSSAYDIAIDNGFEGTEQEWLDSLGGGAANIADFVFTNEDETNSSVVISNKDMTIQTTRDDAEIDADINITAADDVFITAEADDIALSAAGQIRLSSGNTVEISTEFGSTWEFGTGGGLDLPGGGNIFNPTNTSGDGLGFSTIELTPQMSLGDDRYIVIDPTQPNHIHIRAGGTIDASTAELILGGEETNVTISDGSDAVIVKSTNGQYLNFISSESQIATIGDVGVETSYSVQGGTDGTQPTFTGDPLFTASYVRMSNDLVHFRIDVDMDNITSFGSGQYYMTLPFDSKYSYIFRDGCVHDTNTGKEYHISGHVVAGSNQLILFSSAKDGNSVEDVAFTPTVPFTLATDDNFHIAGTFIAESLT